MDRKFLLVLIIYGFVAAGLTGMRGEILILAIPFAVYLLVGLLDAPREPNLEMSRLVDPERAIPGMPVVIRLSIRNLGNRLHRILLEDNLPSGLDIIEGEKSIFCSLAPGESIEISYIVTGSRGIYKNNHLNTTVWGVLGLFERRRMFAAEGQVFVLPEVPSLKRVAFRTLQTRIYAGSILSRVAGLGTDFFGVRSYVHGDQLRYINWRASARFQNSLFCNEFERERVADIWIILDGRKRSNLHVTNGDLFEATILAGAGLAQSFLAEGNRLGLLIYGGYLQWTYPGYGKIQRERILRTLAQAVPGDAQVFSGLENLPTRAFPINAQLILVSSLLPEDIPVLIQLRARGYSLLVISPDPVLFESPDLESEETGGQGLRIAKIERQIMVRRLLNAGVQFIDWDVSIPFDQAVQSRLRQMTWRFYPLRQIR